MQIAAKIKDAVKAAARRSGYEVRRLDAASTMDAALARLASSHPDLGTIVDVGASDGSWTLRARRHHPNADFLLIEALERPHGPKLRSLAADPKLHVVLAAAGDHAGSVHFDASDEFGGAASEVPTGADDVVVPMTTIDDEIDRLGLPGPFAIKLDTHGFELPILAGATNTLSQTDVVIIEAYNFELRPGVLTFPDLIRHMEGLGFRVLDLVDVMRRPADAALWQFDVVFARSDRPEFQRYSYA